MQAKISLVKNDLNDQQLEYYLARDLIAIDCEMMGLNIHRDRLCLVQISDEDKVATLVQIEKEQSSAIRLQKLLESKAKPIKVFHYARTDVAWLKTWLGITVENFFCTKVASKLARTYSDKHGLKELYKELNGKDMNKNQQSSDWGQSDITKEQIQYAADDVLHLIPIYRKLKTMLEREGKWDLAQRAIAVVPLFAEMDTGGYSLVLEH